MSEEAQVEPSVSLAEVLTYPVAGPLLGSRRVRNPSLDLRSWTDLEPVVVSSCVLLPQPERRCVSVLALKTGRKLAELAVDDHRISSCCSCGSAAFVGCASGSIFEFSLEDLDDPDKCRVRRGSRWPSLEPRREIAFRKDCPIVHLASVRASGGDGKLLLYALSEVDGFTTVAALENSTRNVRLDLLRIVVPEYDAAAAAVIDLESEEHRGRLTILNKSTCHIHREANGETISLSAFRLLAFLRHEFGGGGTSVVIVVARPVLLRVYVEDLSSSSSLRAASVTHVDFPFPKTCPMTAVDVSVNMRDIACGLHTGEIKVLNDAIPLLLVCEPPPNVASTVAHWHAHPVSSIAYDASSPPANPVCVTGGEESVLVSWELARGSATPSHTLPRVGMGGIVHVVSVGQGDNSETTTTTASILVYTSDNVLQLFEAHDKITLWKVEGLATQGTTEGAQAAALSLAVPSIRSSMHSAGSNRPGPLVIGGFPDMPGTIQWYDSESGTVVRSLEAAPYNRVSRTENDEAPIPSPCVICHDFSSDGEHLVTVDEAYTENMTVGAVDRSKADLGSNRGVVTTIRFWEWHDIKNDGSRSSRKRGPSRYELVSAMSSPHGPKNRVSALALSPDGRAACTVSADEKSLRLWRRGAAAEAEGPEHGKRRTSEWVCSFKISTPAGCSGRQTRRHAASFSSDGSVLAVAFGPHITLWRMSKPELFNVLGHLDDKVEIDDVQFLPSDFIFSRSARGVVLQTPYGHARWRWDIPAHCDHIKVTAATYVRSHGHFAVSLYDAKEEASRIVFLNEDTGDLDLTLGVDSAPLPWIDDVPGSVVGLCAVGRDPEPVSGWKRHADSIYGEASPKASRSPLCLYALMRDGQLLLMEEPTDARRGDGASALEDKQFSGAAPRLDVPRPKRTRKELHNEVPRLEETGSVTAMSVFGRAVGSTNASSLLSSDLPSLSGAFVRAFVTRNMAR